MYRIIVESNQILSMHSKGYKRLVDILAIVCTLAVIITGFVLHKEVHHIYVYNDVITWTVHEVAGILLMLLIAIHGVQHSPWFKNYMKIPGNRKRVSTIFLAVAALMLITGIILMAGSRSEILSHIHYAGGILFALIAIGHVAKRWKIFRALFSR